ncbi:uncharacterized protein LTR77_008545 [Saxophila tyrrhenica]|uniref:JmjC domain-containing protein n=1 Tax=Saxophila tyrrhenica TaxID=1690608 RepID=A0AAV9P179_9PEZI|nr:hypothetical protein LTR77_008545 [Saxophila tyrrhenica]
MSVSIPTLPQAALPKRKRSGDSTRFPPMKRARAVSDLRTVSTNRKTDDAVRRRSVQDLTPQPTTASRDNVISASELPANPPIHNTPDLEDANTSAEQPTEANVATPILPTNPSANGGEEYRCAHPLHVELHHNPIQDQPVQQEPYEALVHLAQCENPLYRPDFIPFPLYDLESAGQTLTATNEMVEGIVSRQSSDAVHDRSSTLLYSDDIVLQLEAQSPREPEEAGDSQVTSEVEASSNTAFLGADDGPNDAVDVPRSSTMPAEQEPSSHAQDEAKTVQVETELPATETIADDSPEVTELSIAPETATSAPPRLLVKIPVSAPEQPRPHNAATPEDQDAEEALFLSDEEAGTHLDTKTFFSGPVFVENAQPRKLETVTNFLNEYYDDEAKVFVQDPASKKAPHVREVTMKQLKNRFAQTTKQQTPWNCLELAAHIEDGLRPAFLNNEDCRLLTKVKVPSEEDQVKRRGLAPGWKEVEKWALLAQAGSLTEPHQDSHGYSTYITVNQGIMGFGWLANPSEAQRKDWRTNPYAFKDGDWRYKILRPGQTVYFPNGTVHFVFRLNSAGDTLAFGGHVLRCSQIVSWVKTLIEEKAHPAITNEELSVSAPAYLERVARFVKQARRMGQEEKWGGALAIREFLRLKDQFMEVS